MKKTSDCSTLRLPGPRRASTYPTLGAPRPDAASAIRGRRPFAKLSGPHRWLDQRLETLVLEGWVDDANVQLQVVDADAPAESSEHHPIDAVRWPQAPLLPAAAPLDSEGRRGFVVTSYSRMKGDEWTPPALADDEPGTHGVEGEAELEEGLEEEEVVVDDLPGGATMGIFLHELLEHVDFEAIADSHEDEWCAAMEEQAIRRAQQHGIHSQLARPACELVHRAMTTPVLAGELSLPRGFSELTEHVAEMHFHFPVPKKGQPLLDEHRGSPLSPRIERGVIRGVVDLVFSHGGRTYFLDWKSDRVPETQLSAHVAASYPLQAKLYTLGLARVLRLHSRETYEQRFGGLLYVFLRHHHGIVFERPSWDDVLAWDQELQAERPFGYSLVP